MDGTAIKAMMAEIAPVIREYVAESHAPLVARIAELEARPFANAEQDSVVILRLVQEEIAKIPPPEPPKDVDPEQVASLVAEEVGRAMTALPAPQDGKSVAIEDVLPAIVAEVKTAVAALPEPRSVKNVFVNRAGEAVYAFSDGTTENIGQVAGKDGSDVDWAAVEVKLRELVDAIPRPKDGKDGFSLTNFDSSLSDDARTMILSFEDDTQRFEHEMKFPVPIYRGVFKVGEEYEAGDMCTWGGSCWVAGKATTAKPDSSDSGWTLAVKRGRDGKDGKNYGDK
jgi:hypothetical protein